MAVRHPFGGGLPDWVFTRTDVDGADPQPVFAGGAVLQFWNARDGGTEYTDLTLDSAGLVPAGTLLSSDGTGSDGYEVGDIPVFYGPPDVTAMWVAADGGNRRLIASADSADLAGQALAALTQHVAGQNPHGTSLDSLVDADVGDVLTRVDGAFIAWNASAGKFVLLAGTGLNPADFVKTAGGSEVRIPEGNTSLAAQTWRLPAGDRTAAPDAWRVYLNTGTAGSPVWFETFWLSPTGEPRSRASANNRVAFKAQRFSSSSTGDIAQFLSETETPLAWITANGSMRAPNLGRSVSFTKAGTVTTGVGRFSWINTTGVPLVLRALWFSLATAASSGSSVFDVNVNGASLYPSGKPTIAAGSTSTGILTAAFTIPVAGVITVDVDSIGTGAQDLTAQLDIT